jgi:hypothetical protein
MLTKMSAFNAFIRAPLLVCIVSVLVMGIFSKRGLLDWHRMREENSSLSLRLSEVELQRERIARQVEALENNREEQERVIRQVLGYIKPEEMVIEF